MEADNDDLFYLKWNDYNREMSNSLHRLRQNGMYTDVTIACESRNPSRANGFKKFQLFKAHKLLLCVSSPVFDEMLADNPSSHPIIMIKEAKAEEIEAILKFIYTGQVHLPQENLEKFLQVAKFMRIRGLVKVGEDDSGGGGSGGGQPMTRTRTSTETEGSRKRAMSFGDDFDDQDDLDFEFPGTPKSGPSSAKRITRPMVIPKKLPLVKSENPDTVEAIVESDQFEATDISYDGLSDHFLDQSGLDVKPKPPCPVAAKSRNYDRSRGVYECDQCDRTFTVHSSLLRHMSVHTGETTCMFCNKVLSRVPELKHHLRTRHNYIAEEQPQ